MKKYQWDYIVERAYLPMSASQTIFASSKRHFDVFLSIDTDKDHFAYFNHFCFGSKDLRKMVAETQMSEAKKTGLGFYKKMSGLCRKEGEKLIQFAQKMRTLPYRAMSNKKLASALLKFSEANHRFSVFIFYPLSLESFFTSEIDRICEIYPVPIGKTVSEIKTELLTPIDLNEYQKELQSLQGILHLFESKKILLKHKNLKAEDVWEIIKSRHNGLYEKIKDHVSHFGWLNVRWLVGKPMTVAEVVDRILHLIHNRQKKIFEADKSKKVKKVATQFINRNKVNPYDAELIWLAKEYVFLRTYRTDVLNQSLFSMIPLLQEAAARLGISFEDIVMMSYKEAAESLLEKKVLHHVNFSERKKSWLLFRDGMELEVFQGKKADVFARYQGFYELLPQIKSDITGTSAYKGKVKGIVRILRTTDDIPKVKKGDILVAVMTFPNFVPAMEKAAAFVTDEGGILCHASIVSREMKKPCIIGTKIATKVLEDGDEVEVNANEGIVKILKRADVLGN